MKARQYIKKCCEKGFIGGQEAYFIKSTYGIPPEILEDYGYKINYEGYGDAKEKHQEVSRLSSKKLFKK